MQDINYFREQVVSVEEELVCVDSEGGNSSCIANEPETDYMATTIQFADGSKAYHTTVFKAIFVISSGDLANAFVQSSLSVDDIIAPVN